MKVIIAGSRTINHSEPHYMCELEKLIDKFEQEYGDITMVVSGHAYEGPDLIGEEWAAKNGVHLAKFPAKWNLHGKAAGPIRNSEMGDFADAGIIMWDGKSKGAKHMAEVLRKQGKPFILDIVELIHYSYEHNPDGSVTQIHPDGSVIRTTPKRGL